MLDTQNILLHFMMPMPLLLSLGFTGLLIIMFTRAPKLGCTLVFMTFSGFYLLSISPVSNALTETLETNQQAFLPINENISYILVSGNAELSQAEVLNSADLSKSSLSRLIEGIRILRMYPAAKLILSGFDPQTNTNTARIMANVAITLGVNKSQIALLEYTTKAEDEAQKIMAFTTNKPMVLITSAAQMPRVMAEFKGVGLSPYPAPTDFAPTQSKKTNTLSKYTPNARFFLQSQTYWAEHLMRLNRKIPSKINAWLNQAQKIMA